jgi:hypothetical protein
MPLRPLGLQEVEAPTFSDIRLIRAGHILPPGKFLVLISVRGINSKPLAQILSSDHNKVHSLALYLLNFIIFTLCEIYIYHRNKREPLKVEKFIIPPNFVSCNVGPPPPTFP